MSGALIVDGLLDSVPALQHVPERLLLLKDRQVDSGHAAIVSIGKHTVRTVNGIVNRRAIVLSESQDGNTFFIDGKTFDPNRTDIRVKLGSVEEWTVRNDANELHTFHIHQGPYQLVEINGVPQPVDDHRDIVDVPIKGEVKVLIPFTNRRRSAGSCTTVISSRTRTRA